MKRFSLYISIFCILFLSTGFMFIGGRPPTPSCTDTEVESFTTSTTSTLHMRDAASRQRRGQSFTTTEGGTRCKVTFKLEKIGSLSGSTLWVDLYTMSGDLPDTKIATSESIDADTLTGSAAEYTFEFTPPEGISDATLYGAALDGDWSIDGSNYILVYNNGGSAYADGKALQWNQSTTTWTASATIDFHFRVYK